MQCAADNQNKLHERKLLMKEGNKSAANIPGRELIIARVLRRTARPRVQSVDRSKACGAVWGPKRFTNPLCEWDARVGGAIRVDMRGPDGNVYPMGGAFREIVPPERLVFTTTAYFDNESNPMLENLNSVTFEEHEGGNKDDTSRRCAESNSRSREAPRRHERRLELKPG